MRDTISIGTKVRYSHRVRPVGTVIEVNGGLVMVEWQHGIPVVMTTLAARPDVLLVITEAEFSAVADQPAPWRAAP